MALVANEVVEEPELGEEKEWWSKLILRRRMIIRMGVFRLCVGKKGFWFYMEKVDTRVVEFSGILCYL